MNKQSGIGLIEVFISMVVVSIGLLSAIALHTKTVQKSQEIYQFNQSHFLANDLFERLRGNQNYILSLVSSHTIESNLSAFAIKTTDMRETANCSDSQVVCTNTQMLAWDLYQFKYELENQLGKAPEAEIIVHWADVGEVESVIVSLAIRFQGSQFSENSLGEVVMNYEQLDFETRI